MLDHYREAQERYEFQMGPVRGGLATALDILTDALALVGQHGERVCMLYVKVPNEDWYLHIAGWNPVRAPEAGELNLARRHPVR